MSQVKSLKLNTKTQNGTKHKDTKTPREFIRVLVPSCLVLLLGLALFSPLLARTASSTPVKGKRKLDTEFLDINRWHLPFYNDGKFAIDITKTNYPGGYWPAPLKNFHLFGGGLWVGAVTASGETLVTVGYNPNSGAGEYYPTPAAKVSEGTTNELDKVYKYGSLWPPDRGRFGSDDSLVPKDNFSLQDMWMVFSDARADRHVSPGKPLGLEVYLTVYAWNYPANQDIFFLKYKVKNVTSQLSGGTASTLRNVYFGVCMDCDIGDATDDMVGAIIDRVFHNGKDTVRNVGYVGDNNNVEAPSDRWERGEPGVVAMKYLESPRGPDGRPLGMTAFKKFTLDIDPPNDATQYQTMAGIDYRTGIYNKYDSLDITPADKRIIQCSGPFELKADSVKTVIVAVIAAYYGGPGVMWANRTEADLDNLVRAAQSAQFIYDRGWLLPAPPESPNVTLIPLDNRVRITWDNHSEVVPAKYYKVSSDTLSAGWDPLYKQYDFQGYKVWKSSNGTDWALMKQCDLIDGDTFTDTTQAESIRTRANDSLGIFYSLTDDAVINGFPAYYAVTAYCHNHSTGSWVSESLPPPHRVPKETLDIRLEGGRRMVSIIPRWNPANAESAQTHVEKLVGDVVNPGLTCAPRVSVPFQVDSNDKYVLQFGPPLYTGNADRPAYSWTLTKTGSPTVLMSDTIFFDLTAGKRYNTELPILGGISTKLSLKMTKPSVGFTGVTRKSGTCPMDSVRPHSLSAANAWAFRGSDYLVTWHKTGAKVTIEVSDITNGNLTVPFVHYKSTAPDSANGYCLTDLVTASDSLRSTDKYLYCCGGYLALNKGISTVHPIGALMDQISDGEVWEVTGAKSTGTAPAYNVYNFWGKPEVNNPTTKLTLKVRVVPNPYLITNLWEVNAFAREIAFTRLPAEADIRIYTLAGDLVRHLSHKDTREATPSNEHPQPGELGGTEFWDLLNMNKQLVATGVYVFHVQSPVGEQVGKFAIVR
jgi:hypothetical protein